jgi:CheY-like chemotaxis protein
VAAPVAAPSECAGAGLTGVSRLASSARDCSLLRPFARRHSVQRKRAILVLVLTAHKLTPSQREALSARAVALLEKSDYSATELRRLIDQALGRQLSRV